MLNILMDLMLRKEVLENKVLKQLRTSQILVNCYEKMILIEHGDGWKEVFAQVTVTKEVVGENYAEKMNYKEKNLLCQHLE